MTRYSGVKQVRHLRLNENPCRPIYTINYTSIVNFLRSSRCCRTPQANIVACCELSLSEAVNGPYCPCIAFWILLSQDQGASAIARQYLGTARAASLHGLLVTNCTLDACQSALKMILHLTSQPLMIAHFSSCSNNRPSNSLVYEATICIIPVPVNSKYQVRKSPQCVPFSYQNQ
jgi:hypothetical protein